MGQLPEYPVRKFNAAHGIQYGIVKMVQDNKGFAWLMYRNKIQRFDGEYMETWFKGEYLHSLLIDSRERIWVTTRKGVFQFDRKMNRFLKTASDENSNVKIIFEPEEGQIAYSSRSGISFYNEASKKFNTGKTPSHQLKPGARVSTHRFSYINYTIYYNTKNTVWRHNIQTGKTDRTAFRQVRSIIALSEEEAIISTWETQCWYYNFSTGQRIRLSVPGTNPFLFVLDAIPVHKNEYYLATFKGILAYTPGTADLRRVYLSFDGKPLPLEEYRSLHKGKEGTVWACTPSNLLSFSSLKTHINFAQKDIADSGGWQSDDVRSFAEDEQENLWMATVDGLTYWDIKQNKFFTIRGEENATDRLNHMAIRGLVYDGIKLIIGQTNKGIWLYDPKIEKFDRPEFKNNKEGRLLREKVERTYIHEIKTLKNGNHVIIGGDDGAFLMNGDTYEIEEINFPGSESHVEFAYQDDRGTVFIGTYDGLYCFDALLKYQYKVKGALGTCPHIFHAGT